MTERCVLGADVVVGGEGSYLLTYLLSYLLTNAVSYLLLTGDSLLERSERGGGVPTYLLT